MNLIEHSNNLKRNLNALFPQYRTKNTIIYNVYEYAYQGWKMYVKKYALASADTIILGINPGPHGMVQTGVPFGNISAVKNYLGLQPKIDQPALLHPARIIQGMDYGREEPSGLLFWKEIESLFPDPKDFFAKCFVLNYCPLAFFSSEGHNKTPDTLPQNERKKLEFECSSHLQNYINTLNIKRILAVGHYAHKKAVSLRCNTSNQPLFEEKDIIYIPHPSPLNRKRHEFAPTLQKNI